MMGQQQSITKSNEILRLNNSHGKQAIEKLVRAFLNHLPLTYYFPEESSRERIASYFMSMSVFPGLRYGEGYATSPRMEGIAIWVPSDNYPVGTWNALRGIPLSIILGFTRHGGYRMKDLGHFLDTLHKRLAPFDHMTLATLGVAPDFQGKGYTGQLLRHMLTRMDFKDLACVCSQRKWGNLDI